MSELLIEASFCFDPRELETPIWVFDQQRAHIVWANTAALNLWNEKSLGALRRFTYKDHSRALLSIYGEKHPRYESWVFYANNEPVNVNCHCKQITLKNGQLAELVEVCALNEAPTDQMLTVFDDQGVVLSRNKQAERVRAGKIRLSDYFLSSAQGESLYTQLKASGTDIKAVDLQVSNQVWHQVGFKLSFDTKTRQTVFLMHERDITRQKSHQIQLEHAVYYDAITGLPNRYLLTGQLELALQSRQKDKLLAIVYLDLDRFKTINDEYGTDEGNQLLIETSLRLKKSLRTGDILARLGGDEFVIVLTNVGSMEECRMVLERLLSAIRKPINLSGHELNITASLGVTVYPDDSADADRLVRHADQAMYRAKAMGKDCYYIFDTLESQQNDSQMEYLARIEQAIDQDEMELYYQPKINMRTGKVLGAEALIRWNHPEHGVLAPGAFLPVIENTPVILKLDHWVLEAAFKQLSFWKSKNVALNLSVNIAALDLQQDDFFERFQTLLAHYSDVDVRLLELEVLETAALEDIEKVSQVMEKITRLGVQFSLDDFGTGYSSLSYLRRLPAAALKIDQSFVRDMLWDVGDTTLVQGVISLATAFQRSVIAEGVESEEHGELLLRLGCDIGQGYGISRPIPAQAFEEWRRSWSSFPSWNACQNFPVNRDNLALIYAEVEFRGWLREVHKYVRGTVSEPPAFYFSEHPDHWVRKGHLQQVCQQPEFMNIEPLYVRIEQVSHELFYGAVSTEEEARIRVLQHLELLSQELIDQLRTLYVITNCQW